MAKNGGRKSAQRTGRRFKCKKCGQRFFIFGELQRHERSHLVDPFKPVFKMPNSAINIDDFRQAAMDKVEQIAHLMDGIKNADNAKDRVRGNP